MNNHRFTISDDGFISDGYPLIRDSECVNLLTEHGVMNVESPKGLTMIAERRSSIGKQFAMVFSFGLFVAAVIYAILFS